MSPRAPRSARLRPVREPDDEPEVVRAPPEPSEKGSEKGEGGRGGGRAVRAPAEGGAVRAPPDRGGKGGRQPGRAAAAARQRKQALSEREPVVEVDQPGEVVLPAEDDAPPSRRGSARVVVDDDAAAVAPPDDEAPPRSARARAATPPAEPQIELDDDGGAPAVEPLVQPAPLVSDAAEHQIELDVPEPEPEDAAELGVAEIEIETEAEPAAAEAEPPKAKEPERVQQVGGDTAEFPESARVWAGVTPPTRRGSSSRFLTDVIVEMELVTREVMDQAIEKARAQTSTPERVLVDTGALSADGLARALAERYGLDHIDVSVFPIDPAAVSLIKNDAAKRYQAVPVAYVDPRTLLVAMADPSNVLAVDDIAIMTGCEVRVAVASPQDIADLIQRMDRLGDVVAEPDEAVQEEEEDAGEVVSNLRETADDAPVVKLVNQIVAQAVEQGASDVHLSPTEKDLRVRFRVDGVMRDITTVPRRMSGGVVSRVKIMAELDISEKRLPQDGRVGLTVDGRHVDLRVVTLPSAKGESVTMRILDKDSVVMDFDKLGMGDNDRERFEAAFHKSHGCVLVTGPTGSGKTTSLYAALTGLNSTERNIITVEDPVEFQMEGLTQVQVSPKVGLTFAAALRTMVRADPDVIMVGEIRDRETAQIAVESALTGHLVLSTLHTNDAASAIHRLIEMEIEPFLISSAIECVLAQRLARTLCQHCKQRAIITSDVLKQSGYNAQVDMEAYEPVGCPRCGGTGYRGRIALYEVMDMSREIRELALERKSAGEIQEVAVQQGMRRMRDDGLEKVREGRTSMAEVMRVIGATG
jgi:type IV pilus assembly protein PilB